MRVSWPDKKGAEMEKEKALEVRQSSPIEMLKAAKEAGIAPADIQGFLDVQINWEKREAEKEFNSAMARVHANIPMVIKGKTNQQTRSNYAELDEIIKATKKVYTLEGFSVSFYEGENAPANHVRICADVLHRLGHKITRHYDVPLDGVGIKGNANMTAIHGKASSTSYGRRYLMCMIFNIPTGDDNDGNNSQVIEYIDEKEKGVIADNLSLYKIKEEEFLSYMSKACKCEITCLDEIPKKGFKIALTAFEVKKNKVNK